MLDPQEFSKEQLTMLRHWADIAARYNNGMLSKDEELEWQILTRDKRELKDWAEKINDEKLANQLLEKHILFKGYAGEEKRKFYDKLENISLTQGEIYHRIHFVKTAWFKYAAAILLVIIGIRVYYLFSFRSHHETTVVQKVPAKPAEDIVPGFSRAVLTLSDGRKVELDSAASEFIKDGSLSIENNNGQLIYKKDNVVAMNTMTTPKGGQYQLTLHDGTKVWLNAESSIIYPTAFNGKTREVTIAGEAYFVVAQNAHKPFIVTTRKERIEVLGTQFNVNAYQDEGSIKTSLLEGAVKVDNAILRPGQAYINEKIISTDIEQDIAWKNGYFSFQDKNLRQVMKELARWYNLQVEYSEEVKDVRFVGDMSRNLPLSKVLEGFSEMGIRFTLKSERTLKIEK